MARRRVARMTFRERLTPLSDVDRLRVRFTLQHGDPVEIMVQLECLLGGTWLPVRRYDTMHGFLHVHLMPWDGEMDTRQRLTGGLKEALTFAIADLQEHWRRYRDACERAREQEG